jgi:hypothetical protein
VGWVKVTDNKAQRHALVNMVMNPSGFITGGEILDQLSNFSRGPMRNEGKAEVVLFFVNVLHMLCYISVFSPVYLQKCPDLVHI